jgi:hypothetical protein
VLQPCLGVSAAAAPLEHAQSYLLACQPHGGLPGILAHPLCPEQQSSDSFGVLLQLLLLPYCIACPVCR